MNICIEIAKKVKKLLNPIKSYYIEYDFEDKLSESMRSMGLSYKVVNGYAEIKRECKRVGSKKYILLKEW